MTRVSARHWPFQPLDSHQFRLRAGGKPASGITPEKPLKSGVPLIPRSQQGDPGILVLPEKRRDSRVAVKPRDLDPGKSTIPDVAPSAHKAINLSGVGTQ